MLLWNVFVERGLEAFVYFITRAYYLFVHTTCSCTSSRKHFEPSARKARNCSSTASRVAMVGSTSTRSSDPPIRN